MTGKTKTNIQGLSTFPALLTLLTNGIPLINIKGLSNYPQGDRN